MSDRRAALALGLSLLVAGCASEGRTIETPLHVRGWAVDQAYSSGDSVSALRFKVGVETANPCEAQHVLFELQLTEFASILTRHIRPVARYLSDDACVNLPQASSDTTAYINITSIQTLQHRQTGNLDTLINVPTNYAVDSRGGQTVVVVIDSSVVIGANTIRFEVHAVDDTTGAAVAGANVQIDDLTSGSPVLLGSGTTDAGGLFVFNAPVAGATGVPVLPYRVTVTSGTDVATFTVRSQPARGGSRERVFILL